jgi:hypothetical protein
MMRRWGSGFMTDTSIDIAFRPRADEAKALLQFLRRVSDLEIMHALDNRLDEVKAFNAASEKLSVALRKIVEPRCGDTERRAEDPWTEPPGTTAHYTRSLQSPVVRVPPSPGLNP